MSPKGSKAGVTSTRRVILIGNLCVILCMMGARRWPKSGVELPPGQMQFGRPPPHQAGLVILGDLEHTRLDAVHTSMHRHLQHTSDGFLIIHGPYAQIPTEGKSSGGTNKISPKRCEIVV